VYHDKLTLDADISLVVGAVRVKASCLPRR